MGKKTQELDRGWLEKLWTDDSKFGVWIIKIVMVND